MSITPFPEQGQYPWYDQLEQWGADTQSAAESAELNADGLRADVATALADSTAASAAAIAAAGLVGAPAGSAVLAAVSEGGAARGELVSSFVPHFPEGANLKDPQRWYMGEKTTYAPKGVLYFEYHSGWLAQRISVGGIWDPQVRTAPTLEIFPAVPAYRPDLPGYAEGVGANSIDPVTCLQVYRLGHGDTADREYWYVEPHGAGEEYVTGVWASGTGQIRPYRHRAGNLYAFTISPGAEFQIDRRLTVRDGALDAPFQVWRNTATTVLESRVATSDINGANIIFSKARGTIDAPLPPLNGDILGDLRFGHLHSSGARIGGVLRFTATENWTPGSEHGTKFEVRITESDTATTIAGVSVTAGRQQGSLQVFRNYDHMGLEILNFDNGATGGAGRTFLGRAGGTYSAPTAPGYETTLAEYRGGSYLAGARVVGGALKFVASQTWSETAQGTRAELTFTPGDAIAPVVGLSLSSASVSLDTAATLLTNIGGTMVSKRVTVGAEDSAGTGFRQLRVEN